MHQKKVCRQHGEVLAQCRCPAPTKAATYVMCDDRCPKNVIHQVDEGDLLGEIRRRAQAYADPYSGSDDWAVFQEIVDLADAATARWKTLAERQEKELHELRKMF